MLTLSAASPYPHCAARLKGQRYAPLLFSVAEGYRGVPPGWRFRQVGESVGYHAHSREPAPLYLFEVTSPEGVVVPCTSWTGGTGADGYVIVQSFSYQLGKVVPAAVAEMGVVA